MVKDISLERRSFSLIPQNFGSFLEVNIILPEFADKLLKICNIFSSTFNFFLPEINFNISTSSNTMKCSLIIFLISVSTKVDKL